MAFGLFNRTSPATTIDDGDYWNDARIWNGDTYVADDIDDRPLDMPGDMSDLSMTVRTDITRDELELLTTLREYNEAIDISAKADEVRDAAEDEAADAHWNKNNAKSNFDAALDSVKHAGHYNSYFGN